MYRTPPAGWYDFGTHVDVDVPLEFSDEVGEDLMPLWERPKATCQDKRCQRILGGIIHTDECYAQIMEDMR